MTEISGLPNSIIDTEPCHLDLEIGSPGSRAGESRRHRGNSELHPLKSFSLKEACSSDSKLNISLIVNYPLYLIFLCGEVMLVVSDGLIYF